MKHWVLKKNRHLSFATINTEAKFDIGHYFYLLGFGFLNFGAAHRYSPPMVRQMHATPVAGRKMSCTNLPK